MADTRLTKLNLTKIISLCFLAIFAPKKFIHEEEADNKIREGFTPVREKPHSIYAVTKAFWVSLICIILSASFGALVGLVLKLCFNNPSASAIYLLQIFGASILLWGTLFIRGWEIQTYSGITLTERVNQWLYRVLYLLGTSIIICSIIWQQLDVFNK
jgi:hypothetical protein